MMMASEVPTASGVLTASGMPRNRKRSCSTGTMTAPPPTPKTPARMPVTAPAAMSETAKKAKSPMEMPSIMVKFP